MPVRAARAAFTLVEVLIVILVLAILASLVLPSLANASTPLVRPIGDLLEADLRRARIESMGGLRETALVVGAERDRWWLQPLGALGEDRALPSSLRVFGSGSLRPYADHRLGLWRNGAALPAGDAIVAQFDLEGTRDDGAIGFALMDPTGSIELARWTLPPQRTRLK
jgi:prepilin-type N-terminal cleavage/methylation domain-containing protein